MVRSGTFAALVFLFSRPKPGKVRWQRPRRYGARAADPETPPPRSYLAEAQKLSHTGSWAWNPATGELVWSEETYRIFEYDPAESPTVSMVSQRTHPQDRARVQQVIERASKTGTGFRNMRYRFGSTL